MMFCTCPNMGAAEAIAKRLVGDSLAACINIVPGLKSVYLWKGAVESDEELLLIIKTSHERYGQVEAAILELHPYELPEIICVPIVAGLAGYLSWIQDAVTSTR